MRRLLLGLGLVLLLLLLGLAGILAEAHWEIRRIGPPLPERSELIASTRSAQGPVRLRYLNTATQTGSGPAAMAHPSFWLEWPDGRAFLVDAGMDRETALAFGRPLEWLLGADPIRAHGSIREQLGPAAQRVQGIAFTHLHVDHTRGLVALCESLDRPLRVFQTPWQAERQNFTTSPGRRDIESADCARIERLGGGPLYAIPGFPGLVAVAAGGHTPGSTVYLARVGETLWILAGDVTNFMESLRLDRPKPRLYSWLIVPEAPSRLGRLRRWLGHLEAEAGIQVLVSHDLDAIEASGMPAW